MAVKKSENTTNKKTTRKSSSETGTKKSSGEKKTAEKKTAAKKPLEKKTPAKKTVQEKNTRVTKKTAGTKKSGAETNSTGKKKTNTAVSSRPKSKTVISGKTLDSQIDKSNREISALLAKFETNEEIHDDMKKRLLSDRKFLGLIVASLVMIFVILILSLRSCAGSGKSVEKERKNTIALVEKYMDKGQLDPAMELLNGLLIKNPDDEEINALLDKLIELKKQEEKNGTNVIVSPGNSSYDININTDNITNAFKDTIDSMSRELSAANEANAKSQEELKKLLEMQRRDEQERKEQQKALEKQKKEEEAKQKAQEEELAKKNKKNADKINKINELISQGNASLNTGKNDDAIKKYVEATKLLPIEEGEPGFSASKYAEIASNLYDASERENNPQNKTVIMNSAVNYAQKALEKDPSNAKAHFILAMNAEEKKDSATAEKELELAVRNDPNNFLYYYYLGRRQQINKKFEQAKASYQSSIKLNSNFVSSHFNLGITYNKLNLSKDALASFRNAYRVDPSHVKAHLEEARLLDRVFHETDGAIKAYNEVIRLEPDNISALKECGSVYASKGNNVKAEEYFRRVLALLGSEKDPLSYYNLSTVLYNQNKISDAAKYAGEAYNSKDVIRTNKEKAMIVYNYGLITEKSGDSVNAIKLYTETLSLDASNTKAKINLGIMYLEMDPPDTDTALSFLTQAYEEDKGNFEVNNNLGSAYLLKKDYQNAITYYLNALKMSPRDNKVRINLAKAYAESGSFDNAKTTYIEVINKDPDSYDSYIELAKVCIALKDTVSAEGYLTALQKRKPEYRTSEVKNLLETVKEN